jgi:hypothetical protein
VVNDRLLCIPALRPLADLEEDKWEAALHLAEHIAALRAAPCDVIGSAMGERDEDALYLSLA